MTSDRVLLNVARDSATRLVDEGAGRGNALRLQPGTHTSTVQDRFWEQVAEDVD
jgi:hypothetical protein